MSTIAENSTLGNKGYTIPKKSLKSIEERELKSLLTVRPFLPKSPVKPPAFPIYRESNGKYYVPRFFGLHSYGLPKGQKISDGDDIDLKFNGSLRDYQENVVSVYKDCVYNKKSPKYNGWGGLLEIPCGRGKTVIALNIIAQLQKKTLVIVHKNFLVTQWVERIEQFLPGARIGKIQGQTVDIENKDIVVGMLQSLSMKQYPPEVFESFGLTIVDETHHIAAEVFVRSLFQVVTKNVLGLSATMQRKDGLTKVFKMFLGDIIYTEKREGTDQVLVRSIVYSTDDADFNRIKLDYRGNPQYSTMITKLCSFNYRSEFIIKVIIQLLKEETNGQIMILAHNRNLLTYLHDAIESRNIATVGYYVGGMKEKDLKETEERKIVVATYSMAAEALDIKTLTTLVLATPKTDVTQAVGRILRVKHKQPVVVDIVDRHEIFIRQWKKREKFYKSNNYKIVRSNSQFYENKEPEQLSADDFNDEEEWEVIFEPGKKYTMKRSRLKKSTTPKPTTEKNAPSGLPDSVVTLINETSEKARHIKTMDDNLFDQDNLLKGKCLIPLDE
tara:strand:+ start:955 stop:2622 length:1668 start_codon:yes stop_codon:yes gene_type:complete